MKQKTKFTYWLSVAVVGIVLDLALQFVRAWTGPSGNPPDNNVGAPINTGAVTQVKKGGDICVDTNNDNVNEACLGNVGGGVPAGTIVMWSGKIGGIPAGWALCDGSWQTVSGQAIQVPDLRSKFVLGAVNNESSGQDYGFPLSASSTSYSASYPSGSIGGSIYAITGTGQPGVGLSWIPEDWIQLYLNLSTSTYTWTYTGVAPIPTYALAFIIKL